MYVLLNLQVTIEQKWFQIGITVIYSSSYFKASILRFFEGSFFLLAMYLDPMENSHLTEFQSRKETPNDFRPCASEPRNLFIEKGEQI